MITIPSKLHKGDRVALLGGSGPVFDFTLEQMEQMVRDMGLEPVSYPSASARHGYLAGDDQTRAESVMAAFKDDSIKGILTIRGGYGFARVLPLLDFEEIRKHPKFFMGYSDVTAMHMALNQIAEMATWHMPMIAEWCRGPGEYTMEHVERTLFEEGYEGFDDPEGSDERKTVVSGKARGVLCGGNLTLLSQSMGTPWEIDAKGKILFIEEVDEPWWKVDGMLNQLRNGGKLQEAAGIIFGKWTNCGTGSGPLPEQTLELEEIIQELVVPLGVPCFAGLVCGHGVPSMTLPLGQMVEMDADTCTLHLVK